MNRNIITIATGKKLYIDMAVNLARSFFLWHVDTDIKFHIVTDNVDSLPFDVSSKVNITVIQPGELGEGFSPKLHLDKLAPEGQTLFIDSDCLIFGPLDFIFERFKGHDVSVIGNYIADGDWFGNVKQICTEFKIPHLPKFNGGIYYLEKGIKAAEIYQKARDLESKYDEIGFTRLRNRPNDEVLMALAMQLNGQSPIPEDGMIMSDPQACPGGYAIDVINGKRWLLNPPPPNPLHQSWYLFEKVSPVIFHFLGYYTQAYPYKREAYRLKQASTARLNKAYELFSWITITLPGIFEKIVKETLRPIYRSVFGTRKVKPSERI